MKKKIFIMNNENKKKKKIGAEGWKSYCNTKMLYCGVGALAAGHGRWAGRWALGERACGRRWACVGARAGAAGSWACGRALQVAGRAAAGARGAAAGARGAAAGARGAAAGAQARAAGAGRGTLGGRLGGQCAPGCAQLGQVGVLCTLTQFLAWFDSVLFLSH